jgi:hypothetical protein
MVGMRSAPDRRQCAEQRARRCRADPIDDRQVHPIMRWRTMGWTQLGGRELGSRRRSYGVMRTTWPVGPPWLLAGATLQLDT